MTVPTRFTPWPNHPRVLGTLSAPPERKEQKSELTLPKVPNRYSQGLYLGLGDQLE